MCYKCGTDDESYDAERDCCRSCATRFTVFGVMNDQLIELAVNDFQTAMNIANTYSCADYKARLWDTAKGEFVSQRSINAWWAMQERLGRSYAQTS